jgi:uncharacterized cupin superfamily protein
LVCKELVFIEDLVYLMGGERREIEVADFPKLKKRLLRFGQQMQVVDWDALQSFQPGVQDS